MLKFTSIIRTAAALILFAAFTSCKEDLPQTQEPSYDDVTFSISIDKLTIASADLRIRHDGDQDVTWVYYHTSDMETDPDELISAVVSGELSFADQIVAYNGNNKSIRLTDLLPKTSYRLIVKAIAETGELYGETVTFVFRTQRDLDDSPCTVIY